MFFLLTLFESDHDNTIYSYYMFNCRMNILNMYFKKTLKRLYFPFNKYLAWLYWRTPKELHNRKKGRMCSSLGLYRILKYMSLTYKVSFSSDFFFYNQISLNFQNWTLYIKLKEQIEKAIEMAVKTKKKVSSNSLLI